jgi:hypothetical protein
VVAFLGGERTSELEMLSVAYFEKIALDAPPSERKSMLRAVQVDHVPRLRTEMGTHHPKSPGRMGLMAI